MNSAFLKSGKSAARLFLAALILALTLYVGTTRAEGNCPEGYYPIGAASGRPGPQGCAPIPGYNQNGSQYESRSPRWVDQWGALATYEPDGSFGAVVGSASQGEAEKKALDICQGKHGSTCRVELSYRNQCAALTASDTGYNTTSAKTIKSAMEKGIRICKDAKDLNCFTYYSACSLPAKIQ